MPSILFAVMVICEVADCEACGVGTFEDLRVDGWVFVPPITVEYLCGVENQIRNQKVYCKEHASLLTPAATSSRMA